MAGLKSDWRLATSLIGVTRAQAKPRFNVKFLLTRQLSSTNGRYSFQRRPVFPPSNSWSWIARLVQPVRRSAAGSPVQQPADDPESIRETDGHGIQLIGANRAADADVVVAAHHVQRIGERPNIGAAHERRIAAIAQRPVAAIQFHRGQTAAIASQIGARDAERLRRRNCPFPAK